MIDTSDLKRSVDLLTLVGRDTRLKKVAPTRGGEWCGPCPRCGGDDRFRVQPEQGLWFCRGCSDRWQDAIAYVQWRDGVSFPEACRTLGAADPVSRKSAVLPKYEKVQPADDPEPTPEWRAAAEVVVEHCKAALWSDAGAKARAWLDARGLADPTIQIWHLGYSERDQEIAGLWVQRGIIIPWQVEGEVWQLKIRRPAGDPKYVSVRGGHPTLYGTAPEVLEGYPVAVLAEGEFDCLLAWQEARDLAAIVTLGSASKSLPPRAMRWLLPVPRLLVAYDSDDPGEEGAAKLTALSARMSRITVPEGKDITKFWELGRCVRDWLAREIEVAA